MKVLLGVVAVLAAIESFALLVDGRLVWSAYFLVVAVVMIWLVDREARRGRPAQTIHESFDELDEAIAELQRELGAAFLPTVARLANFLERLEAGLTPSPQQRLMAWLGQRRKGWRR